MGNTALQLILQAGFVGPSQWSESIALVTQDAALSVG